MNINKMKNNRIYLTLAFFTIFACNNSDNKSDEKKIDSSLLIIDSISVTNSQINLPDEYGKLILDCIVSKDFEKFTNLLVKENEIIELISKSEIDEEEQKKARLEFDDLNKKILIESKKDFDQAIKMAENDGIIWKNVSFKSCDYNIVKENGITRMKLLIKFNYNDSEYQIKSRENVLINQSWKSLGNLKYSNGLKENQVQSYNDSASYN
jgi:hypothetical protein